MADDRRYVTVMQWSDLQGKKNGTTLRQIDHGRDHKAELRDEFLVKTVKPASRYPKPMAPGQQSLCGYNHQIYIVGFDIGAIIPCLTITLGFVACWNDCLVIHSGPTGRRSERSYCCLDSKGWGSWEARYFSFCSCLPLAYDIE